MPNRAPAPLPSLDALIEPILNAGAAIMDVRAQGFEVFEKTDESPVTVADKRGEDIITKALTELAPHIPVIGEEAKAAGTAPDVSGGLFWLVDPLDGTKEFIRGGTDFTVNIALIQDAAPIMGLVYAPAQNRIWGGTTQAAGSQTAWAADVEGGILSARERISTRKADAGKLTIVASKSHRSPELEEWLGHFPDAENISIGSSLKLVLLAEGKADIYPRLGPTCEWDTAAAHAVLLAAGGHVSVPGGAPLTYGKDFETYLNPYFLCVGDTSFAVPALA